jgi:hypothetical protein
VLGNVVLSPEGGGGGFLFIESPVAISNTLFKANADGTWHNHHAHAISNLVTLQHVSCGA